MAPVKVGRRLRPPRIIFVAALLLLFLLSRPFTPQTVSGFEPWWVQNHRETDLWSGPDAGAISFGRVAQWSYFQVLAPQSGSRLLVLNPANGGRAYIDADAVGPSSPPSVAAPAQSGPSGVQSARQPGLRTPPKLVEGVPERWVSNFRETELWSGPDPGAVLLGRLPQFRRLLVTETQTGGRLKVWVPETNGIAYVDAAAVGPSGPSVWVSARPPTVVRQVNMPARSVGSKTYIRNLPIHDDETELRLAPNNTRLAILQAVVASDGSQWYAVGEGEYLAASEVRLPSPVDSYLPGRWIDVDLNEPTLVTAYEGNRVVYTALAIKGYSATPTLRGSFKILRRVEDETMDSETIGIPRDGPGGYLLKHVLFTQYFTNDGASIHYNYWLGTFGYPGSHGCLGLNLEDARWFWEWASVGTPVIIR